MNISLDGGEEDLALRLDDLAGRPLAAAFSASMNGCEVGDGLLHDAGGFDDLREEHLARAEEIADDAHAVHQRAFNDQQRAAEFDAGLFGVDPQ